MSDEKMKIEKRPNEADLIREAEKEKMAEKEVPAPVHGKPLPEGFVNPPGGHPGHRCVEPGTGRYNKTWFCLKLHGGENMAQRQSFNCAGRKFSVRVGQWVDVPPEVIEVLATCTIQTLRAEAQNLPDLVGTSGSDPLAAAVDVVDERPRFSYTAVPSA
jgi:hypothetical protein